jgi:hypothetical protein
LEITVDAAAEFLRLKEVVARQREFARCEKGAGSRPCGRVANPLALAVLVLLYERPMHPYEMAATLRERRKQDSIKLRYGSLYTVIELLLKAVRR